MSIVISPGNGVVVTVIIEFVLGVCRRAQYRGFLAGQREFIGFGETMRIFGVILGYLEFWTGKRTLKMEVGLRKDA
ncbi:hypothetical protein R1flu_020570 [Riccia fluitans]|uniref:Uncharacterized protein n=1 Tax=Riccia fluitans TaxID=41844 RepID=A0ABD1ZLW0_9MARC